MCKKNKKSNLGSLCHTHTLSSKKCFCPKLHCLIIVAKYLKYKRGKTWSFKMILCVSIYFLMHMLHMFHSLVCITTWTPIYRLLHIKSFVQRSQLSFYSTHFLQWFLSSLSWLIMPHTNPFHESWDTRLQQSKFLLQLCIINVGAHPKKRLNP